MPANNEKQEYARVPIDVAREWTKTWSARTPASGVSAFGLPTKAAAVTEVTNMITAALVGLDQNRYLIMHDDGTQTIVMGDCGGITMYRFRGGRSAASTSSAHWLYTDFAAKEAIGTDGRGYGPGTIIRF